MQNLASVGIDVYGGEDLGAADVVNVEPIPEYGVLAFARDTSGVTFTSTNQTIEDLPSTLNFTLSFWFYSYEGINNRSACAWNGTDDLIVFANEADGPRVFWRDNASAAFNPNTGDLELEPHLFTWTLHNHGATHDMYFYLDGEQKASNTGIANPSTRAITFFRIGGWTGTNVFNGALWDVRLYDGALHVEEARDMYQYPFDAYEYSERRTFVSAGGAPPAGDIGPKVYHNRFHNRAA